MADSLPSMEVIQRHTDSKSSSITEPSASQLIDLYSQLVFKHWGLSNDNNKHNYNVLLVIVLRGRYATLYTQVEAEQTINKLLTAEMRRLLLQSDYSKFRDEHYGSYIVRVLDKVCRIVTTALSIRSSEQSLELNEKQMIEAAFEEFNKIYYHKDESMVMKLLRRILLVTLLVGVLGFLYELVQQCHVDPRTITSDEMEKERLKRLEETLQQLRITSYGEESGGSYQGSDHSCSICLESFVVAERMNKDSTNENQPNSTTVTKRKLEALTKQQQNNRHHNFVIRLPSCKHEFHEDCVLSWLQKSNTCPMCRQTAIVPKPQQ